MIMKARVKATGEIGIISQIDVLLKDDFVSFSSNEVEILQNYADATIDPDYWTRLEHTYAGMAMQGMMSNISFMKISEDAIACVERVKDITARMAIEYAHALVERLKSESNG
jgi:hypothetical protein